jgi:hypothetical protein
MFLLQPRQQFVASRGCARRGAFALGLVDVVAGCLACSSPSTFLARAAAALGFIPIIGADIRYSGRLGHAGL